MYINNQPALSDPHRRLPLILNLQTIDNHDKLQHRYSTLLGSSLDGSAWTTFVLDYIANQLDGARGV